jgi:hypothetical protein
MTDDGHLALINAEIDGELDGQQRGELARSLLADPELRTLREDLRRLCAALDTVADVEPPPLLRDSILAALPQSTPIRERSWWATPRIRYAAIIVLGLASGAVVYETVHGPKPSTTEVMGTMGPAGETTILDAVRLDGGPVAGRVSLYRDRAGLGIKFELSASAPVDVLIAGDGRTLRVEGVGRQDKPAQGKPGGALTVGLPGFRMGGQTIALTFLMDGRQVGSTTLRAPGDR